MDPHEAQTVKEKAMDAFKRGSRQEATEQFELALSAFRELGDELGQAEILNNLGVLHRLQGKSQAAVDVLRQAETIFARQGDQNRQGQALANLADVYASRRQGDEAARCYSDAAALFAQNGDRQKQSRVLRALSLHRLKQGHWLEAMMRMEESLAARPRLDLGAVLFRGLLRFALRLFRGG